MGKFSTSEIPVIGNLVKWHTETQEIKRNQAQQRQLLKEFNELEQPDRDRKISESNMMSRTANLETAFDKIGLPEVDIQYQLRDLSNFPEAAQGRNNAERVLGYGIAVTKDVVNKTSTLGRRLEKRVKKDQKIEEAFAQVLALFIEKTIVKPFVGKGEVFPGNDEYNPTLITVKMNDLQLEKFIEVFPYGDARTKAADILLSMMAKDHPPEGSRKEVLIYVYISNVQANKRDVYQSTIIVCPARMSPGKDESSQLIFRTDLEQTTLQNPNEAVALNDKIQERAKRANKHQKPSHLHHVSVWFA